MDKIKISKNKAKGVYVRLKIVDFLKRSQVTISPVSYREIQDATGIKSLSVVDYHLNVLEKQGVIERKGKARHIKVVEKAEK